MHGLVGWAKAQARPSTPMRDSRTPCPPTESMRVAKLLVGTAHDSSERAERKCQRLCPPYKSLQPLARGRTGKLAISARRHVGPSFRDLGPDRISLRRKLYDGSI